MLAWKNLTSTEELERLKKESHQYPVIIFKHSTRCNISAVVKNCLENYNLPLSNEQYYYLDLITYRQVSNDVADIFNVHHESPQLLVIKNGECVYEESHIAISFGEWKEALVPH